MIDITKRHIDFIKYQWIGFVVLTVILSTFAGFYFYRGGFNYGIDFTGGTQVILRFEKPIESNQLRDLLISQDWRGMSVSEFDKHDFRVRIQEVSVETVGLGEKIKDLAEKGFPGNNVTLLQSEHVSASIGHSLIWNAIYAMLLAILLMMIYIFARFTFSFAVGAVVSLIHDAFAIGAFFLLFNREVSVDVVAAVLLVLGYSMNDTIVIFSRIREQFKHAGQASDTELVNRAINTTLKRTLLTSFATLLVVSSVLILGGEALRNLALALFVGIFVGTYSSIFIASPVMLLLRGHGKKEIGQSSAHSV